MEKKVVVDADAVLTLSEVAKELHYGLRWKSHRTDARKGRIDFTDGEGRRFRLDLGGFAYAFIGKKETALWMKRWLISKMICMWRGRISCIIGTGHFSSASGMRVWLV